MDTMQCNVTYNEDGYAVLSSSLTGRAVYTAPDGVGVVRLESEAENGATALGKAARAALGREVGVALRHRSAVLRNGRY